MTDSITPPVEGHVPGPAIYDKTGREIVVGDIVKVYHFTAALRRKRHFMYKQATGLRTFKDGTVAMHFSHLDLSDDGYFQSLDNQILDDYEIVQSVDAKFDQRPHAAKATGVHPHE